jgi:hypothetical protein
MDEIERSLVWGKPSSDVVADFYESAFLASFPTKKRRSLDSAEILVAKISESISKIVEIYGNEGDQETLVIRYSSAEENGGFWTFDVRFTVKGEQTQLLAAARSLVDINASINKEIKMFIRTMSVRRG